MILLQAVDDDLQESGWKNLTRVNEEATACSVTTEISGVLYELYVMLEGVIFLGGFFVLF